VEISAWGLAESYRPEKDFIMSDKTYMPKHVTCKKGMARLLELAFIKKGLSMSACYKY
jgi:hypothetical protein